MIHLYDVIVIGGGSVGLTAALYLARAKCRVPVLEKEHFGVRFLSPMRWPASPALPKPVVKL